MSSHKHLFVCVFLALPLLAMSQVTNTISYNISNGGTDATTDDVPSGTEWGIPSISNSVAQSKVSGWVNFKKQVCPGHLGGMFGKMGTVFGRLSGGNSWANYSKVIGALF